MFGEDGAVFAQAVADHLGPTVLPDDRRPVRRAGRSIPRHHRLALVGEPDRVEPRVAGGGHCFAAGGEHAVPTAPPDRARRHRPRTPAIDRGFGQRQHSAVVGDHDRLRGRGALIDRQHGHGSDTITASTTAIYSRGDGVHRLSARGDPVLRGLIADNNRELSGSPTSHVFERAVRGTDARPSRGAR